MRRRSFLQPRLCNCASQARKSPDRTYPHRLPHTGCDQLTPSYVLCLASWKRRYPQPPREPAPATMATLPLSSLIAHSPVRDGLPSATANVSRRCVALRLEALFGLCALSTLRERGRTDGLRPIQERIRCRLQHRSRSLGSMTRRPRVRPPLQVREHRAFPYLTRPRRLHDRKVAGNSRSRRSSGAQIGKSLRTAVQADSKHRRTCQAIQLWVRAAEELRLPDRCL